MTSSKGGERTAAEGEPVDTDQQATRVDAPRAARSGEVSVDDRDTDRDPGLPGPLRESAPPASVASASDSRTGLTHSGVSITTLRDTLQVQDVDRTRSFLKTAAVVAVAVTMPLPFIGGNATVKAIFLAAMVVTTLSCLLLERQLRDGGNYTMNKVLLVGYVCLAGAFCGILFFGPFSPAPVIIPFGLYFFGMAHSFRGTLTVYAACSLLYAAMAALVGFGVVPDPGLMPAPKLSTLELVVILAAVELVFFATYLSARFSRRATERALEEHDRAVRVIAGRDALLAEARMDLDAVLRARGLGRFTDEVVGGYRLGSILGRGGMGEVYDAMHVDSEEPAAMKLLHPHVLAEPKSLERFLRECKVASSLQVPNVVKVLAISEPEAAIPFIAMERLVGSDLADYMRAEGRLKMKVVLGLLRDVGRALDAARAEGIVHRDLKPRNVFRAESPGRSKRPTWKLLDFGVSKMMTEATLTQGHVVGTPSYMAPEQASGGEVSHRTDLFALGVIAYRALTGRPAFSGDSSHAILYQVVNEMPPRPSEVASALADDVDLVLAIALAKDPWERFDSAAELADALEKAGKGRLPAALRERGRRVLDKHPWS